MMLNYSSLVNNESEIEDLNNHDKSTETIDIISCILNALLMLISIIGNSLVLAAILRTPSLRSPTTIFLCSLAVSDLFVGLVVQPVYIATSFKHESHRYLVLAYNMLTLSICGVSLFTITAISVDRFLALHCHMRYQNLVTEKRAFYVSATFWFISIVLSFASFFNVRNYYLTITVGISICLLTCSFSYIKIYRIVRRHQLQIQAQQQAVGNFNIEQSMIMVRSKESAINTFIYYIFMILCYSPVFVSLLMLAIMPGRLTKTWWTLTNTVTFVNSSVNPFLYCWRKRDLRIIVLKIIRNILYKQTLERSVVINVGF